MIKAIIFDCFGVLTTDTWNAFLDTLSDKKAVQEVREIHRAYNAGLLSKLESNEQIEQIAGKSFLELEDSNAQVIKNDTLLTYITELKKNYSIGLLSNIGSNWVRDSFLTDEEQTLFNQMVFSFEVGMNKPDSRMFELVANRLGVEPSEAIMIDDQVTYCQAAHSTGMQAIVYQDFEQFKTELEQLLNHV
ncbi:HAD-IA family hydrolase [Candidatus Saccharibacteria bacterium]|nr:HAD-IA family hydrolase [Candidatus Saccharibacteria bacterium]